MIPRNVRLAEVPFYGKPAFLIDRMSKGAQSYLSLANEIIEQTNVASEPEEQEEVAEAVV